MDSIPTYIQYPLDIFFSRAVNASTGMLEYSLTEFDQYEESSDQFDSETSESDVYKHVAYLYQRVLMDSVSKIVKGAVRTILDIKNFTKEWPFKDAADEYLRFISRMVPLVGTQLRKSSVGELVVVPLHATVLDLKIEIEKAMRDTYCIMENLESVPSSHFLKKLVKILDWNDSYGELVLPYYNIVPAKMHEQTETFGCGFAVDIKKVDRWRGALVHIIISTLKCKFAVHTVLTDPSSSSLSPTSIADSFSISSSTLTLQGPSMAIFLPYSFS
ncbi:hypothetical protein Tco_0725544 [Tanacetum coccineum]|uniref:PHD finger protein MALE STERILITY 1-like ubiquitin-like domain-containing protein n=1 Tax=Tanacetum coccineum TaxID=301880 RepID=A0ABQ4YFC7_9ASTR